MEDTKNRKRNKYYGILGMSDEYDIQCGYGGLRGLLYYVAMKVRKRL